MKVSAIVLSYALFATTAFSSVTRGRTTLAERISRRAAGRMSQPMEAVEAPTGNQTNVQYSQNWSGAVITSPPSGQTFDSVTASFVVPTPQVPSGSSSSGTYAASAWVGIDGDTYQNSILQTGVDFTITNGKVSYDAWYEWYPDYAYDFSITISGGNTIVATVASTTSTSGTASIENVSTGKTVTKSLTSSAALGGQNAEWIVEDFEQNGALVKLCNFGTVTFTGCTAKTASSSENAAGATILDIEQSGKVLTSVSISGSTITDSYV